MPMKRWAGLAAPFRRQGTGPGHHRGARRDVLDGAPFSGRSLSPRQGRHGRAGLVGAHLVLEGALRQLIQLPAELVDLVVDAIHLGTEMLVALEVTVKILLVFLAGTVGRDRWVVAAGRWQEGLSHGPGGARGPPEPPPFSLRLAMLARRDGKQRGGKAPPSHSLRGSELHFEGSGGGLSRRGLPAGHGLPAPSQGTPQQDPQWGSFNMAN